MDKLYLDITDLGIDESTGSKAYSVEIIINSRPLIDLVQEVELPFAEAEGRPELAGQYQNHSPRTPLPPSRYLLPENIRPSTTLRRPNAAGRNGWTSKHVERIEEKPD